MSSIVPVLQLLAGPCQHHFCVFFCVDTKSLVIFEKQKEGKNYIIQKSSARELNIVSFFYFEYLTRHFLQMLYISFIDRFVIIFANIDISKLTMPLNIGIFEAFILRLNKYK